MNTDLKIILTENPKRRKTESIIENIMIGYFVACTIIAGLFTMALLSPFLIVEMVRGK